MKATKVERITVDHIVKSDHQDKITDTQYYFCETPSCDVVYLSNDSGQYFAKADVRVRVGIKETEDPIQICYCFDYTERMVRDELITKGYTLIPDFITAETRAGTCACEVKNPSGRCCLGEVSRVARRLMKEREALVIGEGVSEPALADSGINSTHDCCAPKR